MILGAADCGVTSLLNELSMPMLIDLIESKSNITSSGKNGKLPATGEPKSLTEIVKGGKI